MDFGGGASEGALKVGVYFFDCRVQIESTICQIEVQVRNESLTVIEQVQQLQILFFQLLHIVHFILF